MPSPAVDAFTFCASAACLRGAVSRTSCALTHALMPPPTSPSTQDDSNPDFVAEVVELYFEDSASKIEKMAARLQEGMVDYNEMDQIVHQFKGSSASFGARAMAALCVQLRDACHQQNQVGEA